MQNLDLRGRELKAKCQWSVLAIWVPAFAGMSGLGNHGTSSST